MSVTVQCLCPAAFGCLVIVGASIVLLDVAVLWLFAADIFTMFF